MRYLIENNGIDTIGNYPRGNDQYKEPLEGKQENIKMYAIIENIPSYDANSESIIKDSITKTNENFEGLSHLFIAYQEYKIVPLAESIILNNLNESFNSYIEENYPFVEREKHLRELFFDKNKDDASKKNYIIALDTWLDTCIQLKTDKELLIKQGQKINLYNWPIKPIQKK